MGEENSANAANSSRFRGNRSCHRGLDKLNVKDNYNCSDQIYTSNRTCMYIKHIGQSIIRTPYRDLKVNNVLHVPQASKNIASVQCIAFDNNVFFELHLMSSLSRIGSRGKPFCTTELEVSILFHASRLLLLANKFSTPTKIPLLDGMLA
jgi:hypothetical protein